MNVKVDEDLPRAVSRLLREAGHDAQTVIDEAMGGADDSEVWRAAQDEGRLLMRPYRAPWRL